MSKEPQPRRIPRRYLIGGLLTLATAGTLVVIGSRRPGFSTPASVPTPETPTTKPISPTVKAASPAIEKAKTLAQPPDYVPPIVAQELRNQGIQLDTKEIALWTNGYQVPQKPIDYGQRTIPEVERRIQDTLQRMEQSKVFSGIVKEFNQLRKEGYAEIKIVSEDMRELMSVSAVMENNKVKHLLFIPQKAVLNDSNALEFALAISHETEHIKNSRKRMQEIVATTPNITPDLVLLIEKSGIANPIEKVREEARGHAVHARLLLEIYKLGYAWDVSTSILTDLEMFIRFGKSAEDPEWKNYIATTYVGLPRGNY